MTDYSKLVEALRHVGIYQDCNECEAGRWHNEFDCCLFKDAADAIEELQNKVVELEEQLNDAEIAADDNGRQVEALQAEVERLQVDVDAAYAH